MSARLYHFTCQCAAKRIDADGVLRPSPVPWSEIDRLFMRTGLAGAPGVVWLTDDPAPARDDVGLTSTTLKCDRMERRYDVDVEHPLRWITFATLFGADAAFLRSLHAYGKPETWFVSTSPISLPARVGEQPNR